MKALLLLLACVAQTAGTKTVYEPAPKAWTAPMVSFLSSPGYALLTPSPVNGYLLGLKDRPQELTLALAPVAEHLDASVFAGLSSQAKAAALAEALPLAARAVKLKAQLLHMQALKAQTRQEVSEAAEGLRQLELHFGAYAEAAGLSFEKLKQMRKTASQRLSGMIEELMQKELAALSTTFETQGLAAAEPRLNARVDAARGDRSLFFETAVELLQEFEQASSERRLVLLAALSSMAERAHPQDRAVLSGRLGPLMANITDHRLLTAGHLLAAKLSTQGIRRGRIKLDLAKHTGGERAYGGLEGFVPVSVKQDLLSMPRTDDGHRYGFLRARQTSRLLEPVAGMRLAIGTGVIFGIALGAFFTGGFDIWATALSALSAAVIASLLQRRRRALTP